MSDLKPTPTDPRRERAERFLAATDKVNQLCDKADITVFQEAQWELDDLCGEEAPQICQDLLSALDEIKGLEEENDRLEGELDEAKDALWPDWLKQMMAMIRKRSGYDGYDDADGVNLPEELSELLGDMDRQLKFADSTNKALQAQIIGEEPLKAQLATLRQLADDSHPIIAKLLDPETAYVYAPIAAKRLKQLGDAFPKPTEDHK